MRRRSPGPRNRPTRVRKRLPNWARSLAAVLLVSVAVTGASGCSEDRSNLLPGDTANQMVKSLDGIQKLADQGHCFIAQKATRRILKQVEELPVSVDSDLKRSLTDGVVALQLQLGDPETCTESEEPAPTTEPEADTTVTPTGETGPATPEETTTDETEKNKKPKKDKQDKGTGGETPAPTPPKEPKPTPEPPPNPNPPVDDDPGSGGVSPNQ